MLTLTELFPEVRGKQIAIWGTGSAYREAAALVDFSSASFLIDSAAQKQGGVLDGRRIESPAYLGRTAADKAGWIVFVMSEYEAEIIPVLQSYGFDRDQIISYKQVHIRWYDRHLAEEATDKPELAAYVEMFAKSFEPYRGRFSPEDFAYARAMLQKEVLTFTRPHLELKQKLDRLPERQVVRKTVVFNSGEYFGAVKEYFMARIAASLGAEVYITYDDGMLRHWETYQVTKRPALKGLNPIDLEDNDGSLAWLLGSVMYTVRYLTLRETYAHPRIRFIRYSEIVRDHPLVPGGESYDDKHVKSSCRRFFESDNDAAIAEHELYAGFYELSRENAEISQAVGLFIRDVLKPDVFITSHGIYSLWGPAYDVMYRSGIRTWVYGLHAHVPGSMAIAEKIFLLLHETRAWAQEQHAPLRPGERERVEAYMADRFKGRSVDTKIYYENAAPLLKLEGDLSGKTVYCAFPNVIWDGAEDERNLAFEGVIEWLISTIDHMRGQPDKLLLIRCHPAESTAYAGVKTVEGILRRLIPDLAGIDNVIVIPSSANFNTYDFVEQYVDIGIVYNGFLALELPFMGIPVVGGGRGLYLVDGINICPADREQYFSWLDRPEDVRRWYAGQPKEQLYKYLHWYLYEATYQLPIIDAEQLFAHSSIRGVTADQLDPATNEKLHRTMQKLLDTALPI